MGALVFERAARQPSILLVRMAADGRARSTIRRDAMSLQGWLTTGEIREIFTEEIEAAAGSVSETYDDGTLLFVRSILPGTREVRPGDRVQGGVALRATEREIWVHPYVFRQVCSNGAIRAHAIQTRHIVQADSSGGLEPQAEFSLREAMRASCTEEAFSGSVDEMRSACERDADLALAMMPMISRLPARFAAEVLQMIMRRHSEGGDHSRFGLMNAVTSVARDTRDPGLRWRLEEFGGGIPVLSRSPQPRPDHVRRIVPVEETLAVGV